MSRMKKKWLRGGVSLALVAAVSLFMDVSVQAAPVSGQTTYTEEDPTVETKTNELDSDYDIGEFMGSTNLGSTSGKQSKTLLKVKNESAFVVTVPKSITLTNWQTDVEKEFSNAVSIKTCNLAPTQKLTVAVETVTLKDLLISGSTGSAEKKVDVYFATGDKTKTEFLLGEATPEASMVKTLGGTATGAKTDAAGTLYMKPQAAIRAGVWQGNINFTVSTNGVSGS